MSVPTRLVSFSELDAIRQCRLKHRMGYLERWKPATEAATLSRGRLFHEVMEAHYGRMKEARVCSNCGGQMSLAGSMVVCSVCGWNDTALDAAALYAAVGPMLYDSHTGHQTPEQELVEWMYRGYVDHFKLDPDWKILGVEFPAEVWLPTERGTRSSFRLKMKIDVVVRDTSAGGGIWLVDHKTCKNLPKGKELDLDDQFGLYVWGMRARGNDVRGVIYNAVRTERLKTREMVAKERFVRKYTVRTQAELNTIAVEAYQQFHEAYRGVTQVVPADESGGGYDGAIGGAIGGAMMALPLPPRSPNTDLCRWRCSFTEACLASRKGGSIRNLLVDGGFIQDFSRH